uniref:Uncharacterized protein n=1 Tax=Rhizophora mucronata TaxID=61149 RepID=A0A2P2PH38_RHIMU
MLILTSSSVPNYSRDFAANYYEYEQKSKNGKRKAKKKKKKKNQFTL